MSSAPGHPSRLKKLKIAFIGGAFESAVGRAHRSAIDMDRRFELVAGCFSRTAETSRSTAVEYGINPDRAYHNLDNLLANEQGNIDAVVIMTPQDQHAEQVITCLDSGIPVVCEKALVSTVEEAIAIKNKLLSNNGFLAVTYNYTGYPVLRELKYMIEQGRFGKIQQIHMEMPQEGFAKMNIDGMPLVPQEWRLRDGPIPTISLDLGVHLHMMVRFLTGERPEEVVATSNSNGNFKPIVDNVSCLVKYSNNLDCSIWYSKTAFGYRNGLKLRIFGEKGSAEWVQQDPEHLHIADDRGGISIFDRASQETSIANESRYTRFKAGHPAGFIEAFANYYYDIADALEQHQERGGSYEHKYVFGIEESLEGLYLLNAIARSSINKRWETVA